MKGPLMIKSSSEMAILNRPRPDMHRCRSHKWLTRQSTELYRKESERGLPLYISKIAEERIRNHAVSRSEDRLEVMGLLLGSVYEDNGSTYAIVRDVATTDLDASSVSVRFERDGFEKLFESLDGACFNYILVGWYHSHPGHHCFLSATDIDTQMRMFNQPFHSAIVIDPINVEIAAFHVENGKSVERPFAVYWDEFQNPYFGETVKERKKRSDPDGVPLAQ
jgi:proteasome lid subunit RPN8/RPN11